MKRLALILSTIAFVSLLIGCHDLNNPVDPEAASYQGFYTVADPAEVGPDTPSSGESSNYQVFYASKIVGGGPAETYHFTIWDEESTVVLDDDAVAGNILARDLGLSEGSYSWTAAITGKDGRGETVEFFTRGITADAAFDDGMTNDTTPFITWSSFTGAGSYEYQMALNTEDFSLSPVVPVDAETNGYQVPAEDIMMFGDRVYWRVRPLAERTFNGTDQTVYGYWSSTKSFDITWDYTFINMDPPNYGTVNGSTVTLSWDAIDGAASYEVKYSTDSSLLDSSTSHYTASTSYNLYSLEPMTYYWKVRPLNSDSVPGLNWSTAYRFTYSTRSFEESFEDYNWGDVPSGWDAAWDGWYVVDYDQYYDGVCSLRSEDIGDGQRAEISVDVDCGFGEEITFYYMVSSESCCDKLQFYIDGDMMDEWGDTGYSWNSATYSVSSGTRTFKWVYDKDYSVSIGEDCAWIDMVVVE